MTKQMQFADEAMPHYKYFKSVSRRLLFGNRETSEDLTQEIYMKAWEKWEQYESNTNCKAWLWSILKTMRSRYIVANSTKVSNVLLPSDACQDIAEFIPDKKLPSPFDDVSLKEIEREVYFAILALPQQYYEVMFPMIYHDQSYLAIAEQIGFEEGTVKSRVFRARAILRETLKQYLPLEV